MMIEFASHSCKYIYMHLNKSDFEWCSKFRYSARQVVLRGNEFAVQWTFPLLHEILRKFKIGKKYHHSLKEHPKFSKIAEFGCEML